MIENRLISIAELEQYGPVSSLSEQVVTLVTHQKATWELAGRNYAGLALAEFRNFDFGHFKIVAQYNPERIRSSAAKTDLKSINERPCFLCPQNLPEPQKGILTQDKFLILVNPFPIFPVHLTITLVEHKPQLLHEHIADLLRISRELDELTIFYNGPECGASAPDHFHFQAVFGGILPFENEYDSLKKYHSEILIFNNNLKVFSVENYLRRFIAVESDNEEAICFHLNLIISAMQVKSYSSEPRVNILCNYLDNHWRVVLFPREKHRPSQYTAVPENQIMFSPAAVELGGLAVFPRSEDFEKINKELIADMYKQVTLQKEKYINLVLKYLGSEQKARKHNIPF